MKALLTLVAFVAASSAQIFFPGSGSPGSSLPSSGVFFPGSGSPGSSLPSSGVVFPNSGSPGSSRPSSSGNSNNDVDSQLFAALALSNKDLSPNDRSLLEAFLSITVLQGSFCRLPDGNTGTCGRLSQCGSYIPQFSNIFGLIDFFMQRVCSFTTRNVMVCCPQSNNNRPQIRPTTRRPTQRPATRPTPRPTPRPIVPNSLFPTVCGNSATDRIVGGTEIQPGAYPWLVAIGNPGIGRFAVGCGGTLITRRHVLTAAHCFDVSIPSHVRVGEHDTSSNSDGASPQDLRITDREIHRRYNRKLSENDIAVIKLERDVSFNKRVQPICLPFRNDLKNNDFVNNNLDVVGWGTTDERLRRTSPVPREAKVRVTTLSSCQRAYQNIANIKLSEQQLCAGGDGIDSCQGDSGGPLNYLEIREDRYYLAGITSTGVGCGRTDFPGVYVRVGAYIDWIVSNVK